jgi:hypothetical protein
MRLVVFARRDVGGSWAHLATCLRARGVADARVITFEHDPSLGWATDITDVFDGGQELAHLVEHADAFHFVDLVPEEVTLLGGRVQARCTSGEVRVVLQCEQRPSFTRARELAGLAERHGWSLATTRPLARELPQATLLAPFIPLWRAPWTPLCDGTHARARRPDRVALATSSRSLRERPELERWVDRAELIARALRDVRVEVLTGKPQCTVLQRRRRSHLALVGGDGLGRAAFESLVQGIPTVTELSASDVAAWTELAGGRPPPVLSPTRLEHALQALVGGGEPQPLLRVWACGVLDPQRWLDACTRWYGPAQQLRAA